MFKKVCIFSGNANPQLAQNIATFLETPLAKSKTTRFSDGESFVEINEDPSMKLILTLLGVVLLVIAGGYFLMPADQLPGFVPGHEAGVTRMHYKHGIVAGVGGLVLLAAGVWVGRK